MALLQIEDPLDSALPIGIDLGTTHSLVARVTSTGRPVALVDCEDQALVPSVVHFGEDGRVTVGREAAAVAVSYPRDTIVSVKRFMGRGADDPETRRLGPYRFATDEGPVVKFEVAPSREVTPVEVSAEILRHLRHAAEDELGGVGGVVITVPAYFDDAQRQATRDAGRLAGLDVLRLLNEPTAAALAYGLETRNNGTFAVYDLGGGTFDITILSLEDGVFQVRSTGGDSQLGGDDFDRVLARHLLEVAGLDAEAELPPGLVRGLLELARNTKHALSEAEQVEVELEGLGKPGTVAKVTRSVFEELSRKLLDRTGLACRRALKDAQREGRSLEGVILVGGSTRMPCVRVFVEKLFGQAPLTHLDPDQVVALGAAVQAAQLSGDQTAEQVLLLDVLPLSLGVATMGGVVERILPRNTPVPAGAAQEFTTYADGQTGFELHVVQGERELAEDCRSLAHFTLRGIPPMPAGMARLRVTFRVDADGILEVQAEEKTTGIAQTVEVKPSYGLGDGEIEEMLLQAYEHGEQDVQQRNLREQRVDGQRVLVALEKALEEDGELAGDREERGRIEAAVGALRDALQGQDHRRIRERVEILDEVSKLFAGRRMDRSIRDALKGRDIASVEQETADATGIESHLGGEGEEN